MIARRRRYGTDRYHTLDGSTWANYIGRQAPGTSNLCILDNCFANSLVNVARNISFTLGALDENFNLVPNCFKRLSIVYMGEWECRQVGRVEENLNTLKNSIIRKCWNGAGQARQLTLPDVANAAAL